MCGRGVDFNDVFVNVRVKTMTSTVGRENYLLMTSACTLNEYRIVHWRIKTG